MSHILSWLPVIGQLKFCFHQQASLLLFAIASSLSEAFPLPATEEPTQIPRNLH
jgi:hypothetical protein